MDLAFRDLQMLICHKTHPPNQIYIYIYIYIHTHTIYVYINLFSRIGASLLDTVWYHTRDFKNKGL